MKALVIQNGFGIENLAVVDLPDPVPAAGQVLVRVKAASLNYRDLLIAKGAYNPKLALPRVLGSDAAGVIEAVGAGVTQWRVGDRVANTFMPNWLSGPIFATATVPTYGNDIDGVFAELVAVDANGLTPLPDHLSFEEAATLPCAAVTAWNALTTANTGPGATVLLQGTGGVSIFALQFAKALGAKVLITSGSDEKLARALKMGADAGTNYKTNSDWDKWARQQTGGAGVDVVVEVGGAGTLDRSVKSVRVGGHVALIGVLAAGSGFNPMAVLMKSVRLQGVFVGSRAMFEDMNALIAAKQLRPVIDRSFRLSEGVDAVRYLESASHFGKVAS